MSHPLLLAIFDGPEGAARAARIVHELGIAREALSVVARTHEEAGVLADSIDATPGVEIEDSRPAAVLGELSAHFVAAIAIVLPGIGPIVADGPLAAAFGEAAGHAAGDLSTILSRAGVDEAHASQWEARIEEGAVLLGVHLEPGEVDRVRAALVEAGATDLEIATWESEGTGTQ